MGIICGSTVAVAAGVWKNAPILGFVVGVAMFTTVLLGAVIGTLVPLLFSQAGLDPAFASGPLVTTIKDVTGLVIYFSIASLFMEYLI